MLKKMLGALWLRMPGGLRRWSVRLFEPRFTVTTGAVVTDERGRVLLLDHRFRKGSGWGIPGGFMEAGEQPVEALKRELREEIGMEVKDAQIAFIRALKKPRQVEIIFRCHPRQQDEAGVSTVVEPRSVEVKAVEWFKLDELPQSLPNDQRRIIKRVLTDGAKPLD
jgi:ADP-ribose pyrophosphatase YjhB (NUDIX family)